MKENRFVIRLIQVVIIVLVFCLGGCSSSFNNLAENTSTPIMTYATTSAYTPSLTLTSTAADTHSTTPEELMNNDCTTGLRFIDPFTPLLLDNDSNISFTIDTVQGKSFLSG